MYSFPSFPPLFDPLSFPYFSYLTILLSPRTVGAFVFLVSRLVPNLAPRSTALGSSSVGRRKWLIGSSNPGQRMRLVHLGLWPRCQKARKRILKKIKQERRAKEDRNEEGEKSKRARRKRSCQATGNRMTFIAQEPIRLRQHWTLVVSHAGVTSMIVGHVFFSFLLSHGTTSSGGYSDILQSLVHIRRA